MTTKNPYKVAVKEAIDSLIKSASNHDIDALNLIYHDNMQVVMIDPSGQVHKADKVAFKAMIEANKNNGAPMNTWAKFHHVEANPETGLVVLSRKNNLAGKDMMLDLSIDFVYENGRWQVIREVIFLHPDQAL
ncbi:hypothetical protein I6F40_12515 [Pseudoalteromonas sp. SWXJ133]|uniref:nuclear transport factor 2 family protein n=1 Tax=unclassified Pseudoalteromonas TaxID=194690 RepID=UPI0014097316|nr:MULTISPECIES: nuclear transport factor 2 family protein [unclassified Pseudoalteromonas]MBH0021166.1 hypothetical protein [Pseudoalteromonas sp. SWXJ133]